MTANVSAATSAAAATTRCRRPAGLGALVRVHLARHELPQRQRGRAALAGTRNHQQARQSIATVSRPPTTGPIRFAMPELAPQMPSAAPRRSGGKPGHRAGQRGRADEPGADALHDAREDQHLEAPRQRTDQRAGGEHRQAREADRRDPIRSTSAPPGNSASPYATKYAVST